MAAAPKKSGLLIALGGLKRPPGGDGESLADDAKPEEGGEPDMGDDVKTMAANDAFDALKADDRGLFADALDRYVKACM